MLKLSLILAFLGVQYSIAQNLLVNPSAEVDPFSSGWNSLVSGTACYTSANWRVAGAQNGFPTAFNGSYYFYSGCGGINGEVYQDVDVSANAAAIDLGTESYTMSGYMLSYNQNPADGSRMIMEFRDAVGSVLGSYDTGFAYNTNAWTYYAGTVTAPANTKTIRFRLLSQGNGGGSVDGYFDNLELTLSSILGVELTNYQINPFFDHNEILWQTASENNNARFILEKSNDGELWELLTNVNGAGNSNELRQYSFSDYERFTGVRYYKLSQENINGEITELGIKTYSKDLFPKDIFIHKNKLIIQGENIAKEQLELYNLNGQNIPTPKNINVQPHLITMDLTNLSKGIYIVKVGVNSLKFYLD